MSEIKPKIAMESPALFYQSDNYPPIWRGRVPLRVRMAKTVRPDWPGVGCSAALEATKDEKYFAWVNSHGALTAIINGERLGLKPYEFEVIEWHSANNERAALADSEEHER